MDEYRQKVPMISPWATKPGYLPVRKGAVRFAFGFPEALTSNAWRMWANKAGDVYLACRDNMRETKVSLHASGRWRMAFTSEAIAKRPDLLKQGQDRAWEVWDQPPETLPDTVVAFRLYFPTSELALNQTHRESDAWSKVIFIEPAPPSRMSVVTLFIANFDANIVHGTEPSFRLASIALSTGRWAQLVAHYDLEGNVHDIIRDGLARGAGQMDASTLRRWPASSYAYFFGQCPDGARFIVGAKAPPPSNIG